MGGRGASLGDYYLGGNHYTYGDEYTTVLKSGNIKFVQRKDGKATTAPMETMTRGRVYVTVNPKNNKLVSITYFDNDNKRTKQIDLSHTHNDLSPHTHHGYNHNENDGKKGATALTPEEKKMVERVKFLWDNRGEK